MHIFIHFRTPDPLAHILIETHVKPGSGDQAHNITMYRDAYRKCGWGRGGGECLLADSIVGHAGVDKLTKEITFLTLFMPSVCSPSLAFFSSN